MLRESVKNQIIENILRPQNYDARLGHRKFSVLILDKKSLEVINSCMTVSEVFEEGVTLIEDLHQNRQPIPNIDAIYLLDPCATSIDALIQDFTKKSKFAAENCYKSANVFFLNQCPDDLFERLAKSSAPKFVKTLKELNLACRPVESQVFTVKNTSFDETADGIASACSVLNVRPVLRFHSDSPESAQICGRLDENLKNLENSQPGLNFDSELFVLDRNFDLISPLLHETTLQAMAADLTDFKNDIYKTTDQNNQPKEIFLDESDPNWADLRHLHIAQVLREVPRMTKELTENRSKNAAKTSISDVHTTIRELPAQMKRKAKIQGYMSLAEECMDKFKKLEKICILEQDLAVEHTVHGEKMTDVAAINRISPLILPAIPVDVRMRLLLVFMMTVGKKKDYQFFQRLFSHTDLPNSEFKILEKMLTRRDKIQKFKFARQPSPPEDGRFDTSRWDPKLRKLIAEILEKRVNEREFEFFKKPATSSNRGAPVSARFGTLARRQEKQRKIVIFVIGGITHSEMRVAYEMSKSGNSTIYLGSDRILTPDEFLDDFRRE